jgi:hypothetical protein
VTCRLSDDPWPIGSEQSRLSGFFTPARNYFTGALSPGIGKQRAVPAFYSAAWIPRDSYTVWLFAELDGNTHVLDGVSEQSTSLGWGSDIASLRSACGSGWQILATSPDRGQNDSVRAFEMNDRAPVPATQAISIDGRVSALWPAADGSSAMAMSHDPEAGTYDAYRLTLTCSQ